MQGIRIIGTGKCLPKQIVTNEMLSESVETNDTWIRERTGIEQRYQCTTENGLELAISAAENAITSAGIDRSQIGVIIVATSTSEWICPASACMVQAALGLSEEVIAFDLAAACTGFLYGIAVCRGLLINAAKPYALLIGSEQMSRVMDYTDRSTCILFGDGAGAVVLEKSEKPFVHKAWARGNAQVLSIHGVGYKDSYVKMEGTEVFKFAVKAIRQAIEEVLKEAELPIEAMDYIVCHQANKRIIENVSRRYPAVKDRFYMNIERYANTSAASIPIVLDEMYRKQLLKKDMKILCVGFGAGLTWSGTMITI